MAGWSVTEQVSDQVQVTTAGQTVVGVQVYFITAAGARSSVFIPDDHYNEAEVRRAIEAKAKIVDGVGRLRAE